MVVLVCRSPGEVVLAGCKGAELTCRLLVIIKCATPTRSVQRLAETSHLADVLFLVLVRKTLGPGNFSADELRS